MDESGRTDDDFKREVDEKLKMNLFPELEIPPSVQIQVGDQILNPVIENLAPEPPQPYRDIGSNSDNSSNEDNQIIKNLWKERDDES